MKGKKLLVINGTACLFSSVYSQKQARVEDVVTEADEQTSSSLEFCT